MPARIGTRRSLLGGGYRWALQFNGTTTIVNAGSHSSIDDMHDAAMTAEVWIRTAVSDYQHILAKNAAGLGWRIYTYNNHLYTNIDAVDADEIFALWSLPAGWLNTWHHIAFTYDDAGDRKARLYVDGLLKHTSSALVSAIGSDADRDLKLGQTGSHTFDGAMCWARLSNSIRYSATFTPPSRTSPPATDANTLAQWNFLEGAGATLSDEIGNANGTITDPVWIKT